MKNFDLISNECLQLNELIATNFPGVDSFFISSSFHEIVYVIANDEVIFKYNSERYDGNDTMNLKGVSIRLNQETDRTYPLSQVLSFFDNNCEKYVDSYDIYTHAETIQRIKSFFELTKVNDEWESKFNAYKKAKTFKWS